jgi:hypothetical protein
MPLKKNGKVSINITISRILLKKLVFSSFFFFFLSMEKIRCPLLNHRHRVVRRLAHAGVHRVRQRRSLSVSQNSITLSHRGKVTYPHLSRADRGNPD